MMTASLEINRGRRSKGERQGFAHILDDPEKLRELHKKAEERERKLGRHMRRSRGAQHVGFTD